jgi:ABC-type nickel/cobalt efflux system permease component RcnA
MMPRAQSCGRWGYLMIGLGTLLFLAVTAISTPPQAVAQSGESPQKATVAAPQLGPWDRTVAYVRLKQREIQRELADAIKALRQERSLAAAWSLIALSFFYGVFHAVGPGHGKAVISTYLLTQRSDLRKGLALSWGGSLLQGVTAIALVYGAVALIDWTQRDARNAVGTLETVSFALIALVGVGLLLRSLWSLAQAWRRPASAETTKSEASPCGHNHGPNAEQLRAASGLRGALSVIVSIGIRPCSGAVLVLLIAQILALHFAGLAAVLAMSVGTAITVSVLAGLAVSMRRFSTSLARLDGRSTMVAGHLVAMTGGLMIALMGAVLFAGSLGPSHPLL